MQLDGGEVLHRALGALQEVRQAPGNSGHQLSAPPPNRTQQHALLSQHQPPGVQAGWQLAFWPCLEHLWQDGVVLVAIHEQRGGGDGGVEDPAARQEERRLSWAELAA